MFAITLSFKSKRHGQIELLRFVLTQSGIAEEEIVEEYRKGSQRLSFFTSSSRRARQLKRLIRSLRIPGLVFSCRALKDSDWKTRWKKYYRPFNITRDIRIVPRPFSSRKPRRDPRDVYIDTTFAFGTGLHPTTRMMARLIAAKRGDFRSFLDAGTGSGILSLVAHRSGAIGIWAIDPDPQAIKTALDNFRNNGMKAGYVRAVGLERIPRRRRFDFVAANLLTEDLLRLKSRLISMTRPGKYLAVSGIYETNYPHFLRRFADKALCCERVLHTGHWFALLFRKL